MQRILTIAGRELRGYFTTPLAYIFIAAFLMLSGFFTFKISMFFEAGQADLSEFFVWHPWLYLFLAPAISMRLWAEERRSGTIELLFTLPVGVGEAVIAKFLAGWALLGASLVLTFPMVITVSILGDPDMGQIATGYLGSLLMAGGYLAIGCCMSALTKNQVISFVLTAMVCFLFMLSDMPVILDFMEAGPRWFTDAVASVSFLANFDSIRRGVVEIKNLVFFLSVIIVWLYACTVILDARKSA